MRNIWLIMLIKEHFTNCYFKTLQHMMKTNPNGGGEDAVGQMIAQALLKQGQQPALMVRRD